LILNFAIVGCGSIAERHAFQITANGGRLIACCDNVTHKGVAFGQRHRIAFYATMEEMLKNDKIDIVSICTPNGLHAEHSLLALNALKHVVCEKPMALNVGDCKAMIAAAESKNKRLFMVMQNRFNPPVVELKKIIDQNLLGTISNIHLSCFWNRKNSYYENSTWKGTKQLDGGILYTQFSHFIDILLWIFGDVETVHAIVENLNHPSIEIEDAGVVLLKFNKNILCTINYSVNAYEKNFEGSLTVIGENGIVKIGGQYLNKLEHCSIKNYTPSILDIGNEENNYGHYTGSMSNHHLVYENVMNVFNEKEKITTTAIEGLKTVELIQKIYQTADGIK